MCINFLEETLEILKDNNKNESDVLFVSLKNGYWTWDSFREQVKDLVYNNGYGGNEIELDLKIVGKDFWLERGEYDGAEWWEFKQHPDKPDVEYDKNSVVDLILERRMW